MRTKAAVLLILALTGAGLAAALAGCGAAPAGPAAARAAASQPSGMHASGPAGASGAPATPGSRTGNGPGTAQVRVPVSASPAPTTRGQSGTPSLADGFYIDSPDGTPHYVLAFTLSGRDHIKGSASYLYQDGRAALIGLYAGTLSGGGKLTVSFGNGKVLAGSYRDSRLSLVGCTSALPWAGNPGGCTFTYNGHIP